MNFTARSKAWLGAAFMCLASATLAQDYPSRQVTLVVPHPAGTSTDIMARIIASPLATRLKQSVVVENRAGAGGAVGVRYLKDQRPDGYAFGLIASGNVIQPWLQKDMPFDVRKDFVHLTLMYKGLYVVNVIPSFPAKTFQEFLAYVKANPKKVFFGSSGTGTTTHLGGELINQLAGTEMVHVPFKGSPEVYAGAGSGDIQMLLDLWGTSRPMIEAGRIRPLAVTSKTRSAVLPNIPAVDEFVPGVEVFAWTGFVAPPNTPAAVATRLTNELRASMAQADVQKRFADLGVDIGGQSPQEFTNFINADYEKWGRVIKAAGIKQE